MDKWEPGDWVVYAKQKFSTSPGPRARSVAAAEKGDSYSYVVDKYWVISERLDDGDLLLRTRTGKEHVVRVDDPRLRAAKWWERWLLANRFPPAGPTPAGDSDPAGNSDAAGKMQQEISRKSE